MYNTYMHSYKLVNAPQAGRLQYNALVRNLNYSPRASPSCCSCDYAFVHYTPYYVQALLGV